jgi:hypothetical protein
VKERKVVEHIHAEGNLVQKEDGQAEEGMAKCRKCDGVREENDVME